MDEAKKPLCLAVEEAKAETIAFINMTVKKHNVPFWLFESIIADAHRQVTALAKQEREMAVEAYTQEITKKDEE